MNIYNAPQHYYDEWCSLEQVSSLLTSLLAENSGGAGAPTPSRNTINVHLKDEKLTKCSVMSADVPTLKKHKVEHVFLKTFDHEKWCGNLIMCSGTFVRIYGHLAPCLLCQDTPFR